MNGGGSNAGRRGDCEIGAVRESFDIALVEPLGVSLGITFG